MKFNKVIFAIIMLTPIIMFVINNKKTPTDNKDTKAPNVTSSVSKTQTN